MTDPNQPSGIERFIIRHRTARYLFVLITWPFVAIKDRAAGVWNPPGLHELRTALDWAKRGGIPGTQPERPQPAPVSPRWLNDGADPHRPENRP